DRDLVETIVVLEADAAGDIGDRGLALGDAGLEQLLDAGQTTGDVLTDATLVEGTHRQLRTGLTDRLGGDDTDGLADVDELARRHRTAVAGRADAGAGVAGQDRADLDLLDTGLEQRLDRRIAEVGTTLDDDVAVRVDRIRRQRTGVGAGLDVSVAHELTGRLTGRVACELGDGHLDAARRAAVDLADDDV